MTDAQMAAVVTVCFWLKHELGIDNPKPVHLAMVVENGWVRHRLRGSNFTHIEDACRRFASALEAQS